MSNRIAIGIHERTAFAGGHAFAEAGAYERLVGRARFAVDPDAPAQAGIVDVDKAPRNRDGLVEFAADLCILKPVDPARSNRRLFFDYGNRGNKRAVQYFNDAPAYNDPATREHAGNGYLFRRGYTVVWGAWQGDLLPGDGRMILTLPVATDGAAPLTGLVRSEFIVAQEGQTTLPLSGWVSTRSHPTVSRDSSKARLTRRRYPADERVEIAPDAWRFARVETGTGLDFQGTEQAIIESDTHIYMPGGFEPGWIYELVYQGRDPLVLGLGYVAVRNLVSFLKYEEFDSENRANPVTEGRPIETAYAFGRSQTGRCIRDAIYRGFNADAIGRKVFDGVLAHVAGCGRMWMNHRFANVVVPAGQQYEDHDNVADSFPFSYAQSARINLSGRTDAICKRPETDPLIFHSQSATEYWQRRGSLVHTDTRGNDLEQPDNVRVYFWSSAPHVADPNQGAPARGVCQNLSNVVQTSMLFRALLDAMDRWASAGVGPPASRIPKVPRWQPSRHGRMAHAVPRHSRGRHPARAQRVAALRLRTGGGGRHSEHAAARSRRFSTATRCWCRRSMPTATTSPGYGCQWLRRRSPHTPAGTCAAGARAKAPCTSSPAARSPCPKRNRHGPPPATRGRRSSSAMATQRPTSPRSSRRRNAWSPTA